MEVHPHDESFDLQEIHRARVRHRNCIDESGESIPCGFEALAQDYALQLETKVKEIVEDYCHVDSMDVEESGMLLLLCCLMTRRVAVDVLSLSSAVDVLSPVIWWFIRADVWLLASLVVMRFLLLLEVTTIPSLMFSGDFEKGSLMYVKHSVVALALFQSVVDRGGDVFVVLIVSNHRFLAEFFRLQSNDLEF
ncbi:hypothetical protein HID58_062950 [Brassica napus]|uniref:Uncharacterized protein n=1 Tax=Brassica napus TaxID=3708 RepID=A0ABQ8A2X5_BRANA|nr:hypothetical protein HID58_092739 [Brassica napus]KAH0886851.1 hypothetical protein HID58_062947 [Brassica napus]KAH0886854.1 hypothetical protein HID58_062950 [Brassica napus]